MCAEWNISATPFMWWKANANSRCIQSPKPRWSQGWKNWQVAATDGDMPRESRGWVGYYHLANMKRLLLETDEWLRRRIRMCIWKAWKKAKTKVANLIICGINKYQAYEWGNTRKGYWRIADSPILKRAIDNNKLRSAGYATLMEAYLEWYPK